MISTICICSPIESNIWLEAEVYDVNNIINSWNIEKQLLMNCVQLVFFIILV